MRRCGWAARAGRHTRMLINIPPPDVDDKQRRQHSTASRSMHIFMYQKSIGRTPTWRPCYWMACNVPHTHTHSAIDWIMIDAFTHCFISNCKSFISLFFGHASYFRARSLFIYCILEQGDSQRDWSSVNKSNRYVYIIISLAGCIYNYV